MHAIRRDCPWDGEQTHHSLLTYLIEEACEAVDAVETGTPADLCEELGDVLLQVLFHAEIAAEAGHFTIADVAQGIADKLIERHPYVFSDTAIPDDLTTSWEQQKRQSKHRTSALEGIPERLSAVARAAKVAARVRAHDVEMTLADEPISEDELGQALIDLAFRAQAAGIDPEQAARQALRDREAEIRAKEIARS
ncbi:MAG: MazG nucleotide pyrophosphohydrolase domain-containing protein [Propionibacteriaceae bacterium]